MVAEGDAAFSQEMRESLVPKANLSGHSFEGPAGSVGSLRLLKEVFGCPQLLLRESSMVVRSVPSSSDRLVCSHHLTHRWGEFRQASRQVHHKRLTRNITYVNVGVALREFLLEGFFGCRGAGWPECCAAYAASSWGSVPWRRRRLR